MRRLSGKQSKFVDRIRRLYEISEGELFERLRASDVFTARLNRLKTSSWETFINASTVLGLELTPLEWYPDGFVVLNMRKGQLAETELVKSGSIFIQNASSFLPVLALQPKAGERILDACAAPGGKTSMIAALTENAATLWVNDGISHRLKKIEEVQSLLGFTAAHLTSCPAQYIDKFVDQKFDRILLDAQCSGEGMVELSRPASLEFWSPERVEEYSHLQTKMLTACFKLLRPGGTMVYSTCTLSPEENEAPVSKLLKRCKDAVVEPIFLQDSNIRGGILKWETETYDSSLTGALRVIPHGGYMEGFFACRIRKLGEGLVRELLEPIDLAEEGRKRALLLSSVRSSV